MNSPITDTFTDTDTITDPITSTKAAL